MSSSSVYSVMQPYFLPYLGYWQMLNAVDQFVVYDDVQYVKGSWINRNKIMTSKGPSWISLPMKKAPLVTNICDSFADGPKYAQFWEGVHSRLYLAYRDFDFYKEAERWVTQLSELNVDQSLGRLLFDHINFVCERLAIQTKIVRSTDLAISQDLDRTQRLLEIGAKLECTCYVNSPGGKSLYSVDEFAGYGFQLCYFQPELTDVLVSWDGEDVCLSLLDNIARFGEDRVRELVKLGSIQK